MSIGNRIKQRRKELDMSVEHLADILGKNRATIYRYENDEIENLPTTILEPLAKVLGTTPAELMGWGTNEITNEPVPNNALIEYFSNYNFSAEETEDIIKYADFILSRRNI